MKMRSPGGTAAYRMSMRKGGVRASTSSTTMETRASLILVMNHSAYMPKDLNPPCPQSSATSLTWNQVAMHRPASKNDTEKR
jgi:hypothetical protein